MTDDLKKTLDASGPIDDQEDESSPDNHAPDEGLPLVLTAQEVAGLLRVSYRTIITMAKDGDIPATVIGGQWRFTKESIRKWLEDCVQQNFTGYPKI